MSRGRDIIDAQVRFLNDLRCKGKDSVSVVCSRNINLSSYDDFKLRSNLTGQVDCSLSQIRLVSLRRMLALNGIDYGSRIGENTRGILLVSGTSDVLTLLPNLRRLRLFPILMISDSGICRLYPPYAGKDLAIRTIGILSLAAKYRLMRFAFALRMMGSGS